MRRLFLLLVCALSASATTIQLEVPRNAPDAQLDYAIRIGKPAIEQLGHSLSVKRQRKIPLSGETYEVMLEKQKIRIRAANGRSAIYAMLDLAEQLESGKAPESLPEGIHRPRIANRAIQFNLPWAPDIDTDCFQQQQAACRNLDFWTGFLDMMVENRFNALALQSPSPGYGMVPENSGRPVIQKSEMSDWQAFWTQLFALAGERGIETFLVVEEAAISPETEDVVRGVLKQYPGLTGLSIVTGMESRSAKAGKPLPEVLSGESGDVGRPVRYLHLANDWDIGLVGGSQGTVSDLVARDFAEPLVRRVRAGFYRLRWGHPDFVRSFVRKLGKSQTSGVMIGSEAIIPLEDLLTREGPYRTWKWQFERQWLRYAVWGRLLYDSDTPDATFVRMFMERFPECDCEKLLTAWKLASSIPLELSNFLGDSADANYFMDAPGWRIEDGWQTDFLDINQLISHPVADPDYINIRDFVRSTQTDRQGKTTPFNVVKKLQDTVTGLDRLMKDLETDLSGDSALTVELADMEAWRHLGRYMGEKLKAGVAVESGRFRYSKIHLTKARAGLRRAINFWMDYVEAASRYNEESRFCDAMSLSEWTPLVEKDVALSEEFYPAEPSWEKASLKGEPHARHEAAFIECGGDLFLLGGRRIQPVDRLDLDTREWQAMAEPPIELHHFQPVQYAGKIWVIGAMTGAYPDEKPVPNVYIFDPETNTWSIGPGIPADRLRGGAGAVYYGGSIYLVGGIQNGHHGGFVPWLDRLDPSTGKWEVLPDAPHARDHFQAVAMGAKLYAVGGRRTSLDTGEVFSLTIPEVDAFDIVEGTWSTVSNLPTPRAGTSTLAVKGHLVVAGGEAGSQSLAFSEVEAFNPETGVWVDWPSLRRGRHGTGMVLHDGMLYTTSGCGKRGGNPELTTTEVLTVVK